MKVLFLGALTLLLAACNAASEKAATPADAQPEFRTTATIKDIMDSIIDPNADELWQSVSTVVDATGMHERYPKTDEEWMEVRRNAIRLLEGSNLLLIPGRKVALPHEKSENPGIELEPEEMQALIDKDRKTFESLAHELHDKVMIAFNAIEKRDKDALLDSGFGIDEACESCHVRYWYPNEAQNQEQYRQAPPPPGK